MAEPIEVVGAAIVRDGMVLCTQRGPGRSLAGKWEFPGGKIEEGEAPEAALARELEEELGCVVAVGEFVCRRVEHYDFATIALSVYLCTLEQGEPELSEHAAARWVAPADMPALDWAPADADAVAAISTMAL